MRKKGSPLTHMYPFGVTHPRLTCISSTKSANVCVARGFSSQIV